MRMFHEVDFDSRLQSKKNDQQTGFLGLRSQVLSLFYLASSLSLLLPLIVYAYLGTFSRYRGDDYCETSRILNSRNPLQASTIRYLDRTGRYSTLLLVQVSEWFGKWGMIYMAATILLVWLIGLTWMMSEIGDASGLHWNIWLSFVLAALVIFFSLYRAPNLYQILFWRSGMVSYLAPVILLVYLAAFILHQLHAPLNASGQLLSSLLIFIVVLITGGTSETVGALQIIILLLSFPVLYLWTRKIRKDVFLLLGTALVSAALSMLIMALSPGNPTRMHVTTLPMPDWFFLGIESLTYAVQFILDSFKVSPLPSILVFFMPFLLFYGLQKPFLQPSSQLAKKLRWVLFLIPLGVLIAIAVNFAPSAYAQSYPSARVRFPSLFLLTLALIAEGGLSGYLLSQIKPPPANMLFRGLAFSILILMFLYPVRSATKLYDQAPEYRAEAAAWDARDEHIRQAVAQGATDLVVVQLDTIGGVQEYKGDKDFWVNSCAANFYGLRSLRAP
jgi:hypothetical protein